jgi:hypothetical protein
VVDTQAGAEGIHGAEKVRRSFVTPGLQNSLGGLSEFHAHLGLLLPFSSVQRYPWVVLIAAAWFAPDRRQPRARGS